MNTYLKTILTVSVCVSVLGVLIHQVIHTHHSEITKVIQENPTLRSAFQILRNVLPIEKFFASVRFFSTSHLESNRSPSKASKVKVKERMFTKEQLEMYNGKKGSKGLYLAFLGRVYNVKKGKKHYGPGGGYEFFAGRDASRAYITGDFSDAGLVDDVSGLSSTDYIGLDEWLKFYESDYKHVGKLVGRYYDEGGEVTPYHSDVLRWVSEAHQEREKEDVEKKFFPPCNSEWNPETGSRLWCTKRSGGVERDWVGVPRKLFSPGKGKSRCACVKPSGAPSHDPTRPDHSDRGDLDHPNLQEYPNCDPKLSECVVKLD